MTAPAATRGGPIARARDFLTSRPGFLRNILIFLGTIVVGIVAFGVFVSQEGLIYPWSSTTTYYANFQDAAAIAPGEHQEVRVAGVHVGQLGSASVTKADPAKGVAGGLAHVQLKITTKNLKIYQNATALLQAKTPLNEMYIEVNPGTPSAPLLAKGGTIPLAQTQSPIEVDQILQHLGPNVQAGTKILLEQTNAALQSASQYLPTDLQGLNTTVGNLKPLATALSTRDAEIKTLVTDLTQLANVAGDNQGRLASILDTAETTLNTLQANDGALSQTIQALPGTTQALGNALPKVQALAGQVNPLLDHVRASATTLPKALDTLNSTLQNLKPDLEILKPLIASANPVVANLHVYLKSANPTLGQLNQIDPLLKTASQYVSYDMPWLNGFFYNTNSLTSIEVDNKPQIRSLIVAGGSSANGACAQIGGLLGLNSVTSGLCGLLSTVG